jgi:hypothetical protein
LFFLFFAAFHRCHLSFIFLPRMVKSNCEGKTAGFPVALPTKTNGNLIPLEKTLIIVVSITESCSGFLIDFRTPCLWGNETRARSLEFDTFFSLSVQDYNWTTV